MPHHNSMLRNIYCKHKWKSTWHMKSVNLKKILAKIGKVPTIGSQDFFILFIICLVPSALTLEILKSPHPSGRAVNVMQKQNQFSRRPPSPVRSQVEELGSMFYQSVTNFYPLALAQWQWLKKWSTLHEGFWRALTQLVGRLMLCKNRISLAVAPLSEVQLRS